MGRMVLTRQGERFTGSLRDITKTWMHHFSQVLCIPERESAGGWAGDEKRGEKEGCDGDSITKGPEIGFHP